MAETPRSVRRDDQLASASPAPEGGVDVSPLLGTWWNTDKTTGGVIKMVLDERAGAFVVRAFGACAPAPCDWGERPAAAYTAAVGSRAAMAFSATYDFGFLETVLAAYSKAGILVLDTFNTFKDASGRSNYFTREFFHR